MVTSEWPTAENPHSVPFIVRGADFLRRAGVDVDVFAFRGAKRPVNYLRSWRQLQGRLRSERYDLVHAQFGQSGLLAIPKSLPLVVTFRGSDLERIVGRDGRYTLSGSLLRMASRFVARIADEVIVVSRTLARHLPPRPFHIIPSGVDLELFRPMPSVEARVQLGLPEGRRLVLFAADPRDPVKRYWLARAAVDRINEQEETDLVVAHGLPHSKMPLYMSACEVLLLTSMHEGSPNVVKEALACNLAVVSTDVGDVRSRVADVDGCAVVRDSPDDIAAALRVVLGRNRRVDSRRSVVHLDEARLAEDVINVYRKALRGVGQ